MTKNEYEIYTEAYGKVRSGKTLDQYDYGVLRMARLQEYDARGKLAVTLAAEDCKNGKPLRTRSEFEAELTRLQG